MKTLIAIFLFWLMLITQGCNEEDTTRTITGTSDEYIVNVPEQPDDLEAVEGVEGAVNPFETLPPAPEVSVSPSPTIEEVAQSDVYETEEVVLFVDPPPTMLDNYETPEPLAVTPVVYYTVTQGWDPKNGRRPFPILLIDARLEYQPSNGEEYQVLMNGAKLVTQRDSYEYHFKDQEYGQMGVEQPGPFPRMQVRTILAGRTVVSEKAEWIQE